MIIDKLNAYCTLYILVHSPAPHVEEFNMYKVHMVECRNLFSTIERLSRRCITVSYKTALIGGFMTNVLFVG